MTLCYFRTEILGMQLLLAAHICHGIAQRLPMRRLPKMLYYIAVLLPFRHELASS